MTQNDVCWPPHAGDLMPGANCCSGRRAGRYSGLQRPAIITAALLMTQTAAHVRTPRRLWFILGLRNKVFC